MIFPDIGPPLKRWDCPAQPPLGRIQITVCVSPISGRKTLSDFTLFEILANFKLLRGGVPETEGPVSLDLASLSSELPSRLSTPRLLVRIYVGASYPLSPVVRFPGGRCRNFLFPHPVATTHTVYAGNDQRTLACPLRHRNRLNISRESITRISLRNFPASP